MKKQLPLDAGMVLSVLVADQVVKALIQGTNLGIHGNNLIEHTLIPGILSITKLYNDGAAWSFLKGQQWFFWIVTIIAVIAIIYAYIKFNGHKLLQSSLALIFAGALGNFFDRARQGYVVDMFDLKFINFPIFNIADMALTFGVIFLFVAILRDKDLN
ncbi:signal peptidase II [Periweissella fabalis]|uniref:Lipoprotein signal peptidase n=1 Tax=Periweissella fabalis TaxID=1070421 RepID=A0A7X6MZZ9_9LACO|nr:signal peptidase II [Periweissella fabalis]MCM0598971.1 signal peptidase II [Periweissella fabalis]NKZ23251.1 signal peptidase II [Periweissella fabalis]